MGRLVQAPQMQRVTVPGRGGLESAGTAVEVPVGGDNFADRVAKYIPGEVIAGYMALDRSLVPNAKDFISKKNELLETVRQGGNRLAETVPAGAPPMTADWQLMAHSNLPVIVLIVGLIFTPLYIRQVAKKSGPDTPWTMHATVATLAFFVWAYAIQGSAFTLGPAGSLYDGRYASALVIIFTLLSGLFEPTPIGGGGPARTGDNQHRL